MRSHKSELLYGGSCNASSNNIRANSTQRPPLNTDQRKLMVTIQVHSIYNL